VPLPLAIKKQQSGPPGDPLLWLSVFLIIFLQLFKCQQLFECQDQRFLFSLFVSIYSTIADFLNSTEASANGQHLRGFFP